MMLVQVLPIPAPQIQKQTKLLPRHLQRNQSLHRNHLERSPGIDEETIALLEFPLQHQPPKTKEKGGEKRGKV